mgnify:CR=1 FL=1
MKLVPDWIRVLKPNPPNAGTFQILKVVCMRQKNP